MVKISHFTLNPFKWFKKRGIGDAKGGVAEKKKSNDFEEVENLRKQRELFEANLRRQVRDFEKRYNCKLVVSTPLPKGFEKNGNELLLTVTSCVDLPYMLPKSA